MLVGNENRKLMKFSTELPFGTKVLINILYTYLYFRGILEGSN